MIDNSLADRGQIIVSPHGSRAEVCRPMGASGPRDRPDAKDNPDPPFGPAFIGQSRSGPPDVGSVSWLGHRLKGPTRVTSAGTRMVRTSSVSISNPTAMMNAIWRNSSSGMIANSAKLPARIKTSDGDRLGSVLRGDRGRGAQRPGPSFTPDAADEKHVVIRAQRDKQHRRDERHEKRQSPLAQDPLKHGHADPQRRSETQQARRDPSIGARPAPGDR